MPTTINFRGQSFTFGEMIRSMPLVFAAAWFISFFALLCLDFRQAPRQAATLLALQIGQATALARIESVVTNRVKRTVSSYDVSYSFETADGTMHSQVQRIPAEARTSTDWPTIVHYSPRFPSLSSIDTGATCQFVWVLLKAPTFFAVILSGFGLLAFAPIFFLRWLGQSSRDGTGAGS